MTRRFAGENPVQEKTEKMTSRERLKKYRRLGMKIRQKRESVARRRARAENLSGGARYEVVSVTEKPERPAAITYRPMTTETQASSRLHDPFGDACAAFLDAKAELDALLKERRREREAVRRIIAGLPSSDRRIMRLHYLRGWSWARIQKVTGFSAQYLKNRHGDILNNL
jgi:DNA-directed RNA polymerase specialized sigma24 family protein